MCGRFQLSSDFSTLETFFAAHPLHADERAKWTPKAQVFPGDSIPVLISEKGKRELRLIRWGLIPSWSKEMLKKPLINARSETVAEKPSFKKAVSRGRCLIPAEAFLEWKNEGGKKFPYRMSLTDRPFLAMAAVRDTWLAPDGTSLETVAILTTRPNGVVAPIHDRMPAILDEVNFETWLAAETALPAALRLLEPFDDSLMEASPLDNMPSPVAAQKRNTPVQLSLFDNPDWPPLKN